MNLRPPRGPLCNSAVLLIWLCAWSAGSPATAAESSPGRRLAAARRFVEDSDKYLHQSQLRRGMTGYGLTVLAGIEIVRFDVEIVSVMSKWGPHQDVIFARLSGHGLEKTGIIQGMSGSPCYIRHNGKDKLIGAVAYGWRGGKEPQCGIQPITQMLAAAGIGKAAEGSFPASQPASTQAADAGGRMSPALLAALLDPQKRDFATMALPARRAPASGAGVQLVPLATPLMVRSSGRRSMELLANALGSAGMVPVQAAGTGPAGAADQAKLVPGAAISVPMVTGDANFSAVGTVTDVIGDRVLAFGHGFYADGQVKLPIGTAYVNTVVSTLFTSFKLASDLEITGTLDIDEMVAVAGRIGPIPSMIPMTMEVRWDDLARQEGYTQKYSYQIVRHRWLTSLMVAILSQDVVWGWRNPPEQHTVWHEVEIDFEGLGRYRTSNVMSDRDVYSVVSDATRPLTALLNNPFGKPPKVERIAVRMRIAKGTKTAKILQLRLDGRVYRPGQTVTGNVTVELYRQKRKDIPIRFELPKNLPDGAYELTACDFRVAARALKKEMPQRFRPRTVRQMFEALNRVVQTRGDRLYLRLPLGRGGLALGQRELPDLPASKAAILRQADEPDTRSFTTTLVRQQPSQYVFRGSGKASFQVKARPSQIMLRQQKE